MNIYSAATTIFLVMDPFGNVPTFLSILSPVDAKRRSKIILRESLIAFVILAIFLFCGRSILESLNISTQALGIAGGIILFLIALKMIFPTKEDAGPERSIGEPFVVPLAIPLIAGPSAMAAVMLLESQAPNRVWEWFAALAVAAAVSTIILLFANTLRKILGAKGLIAMERLMGMILITLAIQMFLNGIVSFFE